MDENITLWVSGFMTIPKDDLIIGRYSSFRGIVAVDPSSMTVEELTKKINDGEVIVLVERNFRQGNWDDMDIDVKVTEPEENIY